MGGKTFTVKLLINSPLYWASLKAEQIKVKPFVASQLNHERLDRPHPGSGRTVKPSSLPRLKSFIEIV